MRCKNCGWDNPDENVRCEKCNASLSDAVSNDRVPQYGYAQDEFSPRATVSTADRLGDRSGDFNVKATITGCGSCGYPVRPDDTVCPICGSPVFGGNAEIKDEKKPISKPLPSGTIIQGANFDKEKAGTQRKKLTGFLVTYDNVANGEFFPLYEGKNFIGRDESSNVVIQGDESVSERHLSIIYRPADKKFKFKDDQSSNGTFINGELIDEGVLKNLDMIRIGSTKLLFIEIPLSSFE